MYDPELINNSADAERGDGDSILQCRDIVKKFPGNIALDHVDLDVKRGEVHALVGQNGAGKSTLVKIITGVYSCDKGTISIDGKAVQMNRPQDAEREGIAIIHQDQQLVPLFDVKRNIFLGREKKKKGLLDFQAMHRETQVVLDSIGVEFGPDELVCNLSVGQREQVAIAAALYQNPKILILDEPTASLSRREVQRLFEIIRALKERGVTVIYISHHFDEIFEISDRITVLRDGKRITTLNINECNKNEVIRVMIGREISQLYPKEDIQRGEVLLELRDLRYNEKVNGIDLTLRRGEILGIAGILGSGIAELASCLFGVNRITGGQVLLDGQKIDMTSPRIAKRNGLALIPEDRRNEGLVTTMTVKENLSLAFADNVAKRGVLQNGLEKNRANQIIDRLRIKTTGMQQYVSALSGGNQQKVVIGRWLLGDPRIFILNQPTTGVDVGSKIEIYKVMMDMAKKGAGVILISQDFEELLGMSDRILVVSNGRTTKEFAYGEATRQDLLQYATSNA